MQDFNVRFTDGVINYDQFKELTSQGSSCADDQELEDFCQNVFKMFDINKDGVLTFEEFTFATVAHRFEDPETKLSWLFDHVYDKVSLAKDIGIGICNY